MRTTSFPNWTPETDNFLLRPPLSRLIWLCGMLNHPNQLTCQTTREQPETNPKATCLLGKCTMTRNFISTVKIFHHLQIICGKLEIKLKSIEDKFLHEMRSKKMYSTKRKFEKVQKLGLGVKWWDQPRTDVSRMTGQTNQWAVQFQWDISKRTSASGGLGLVPGLGWSVHTMDIPPRWLWSPRSHFLPTLSFSAQVWLPQ